MFQTVQKTLKKNVLRLSRLTLLTAGTAPGGQGRPEEALGTQEPHRPDPARLATGSPSGGRHLQRPVSHSGAPREVPDLTLQLGNCFLKVKAGGRANLIPTECAGGPREQGFSFPRPILAAEGPS